MPSVASITCSSSGPSVLHGPHHSAQRSTTTGTSLRLVEHFGLEGFIGDIDCCHGVNATGPTVATLGTVMTDSDPTSEPALDATSDTIDSPVPGVDIAPVSAWLEQNVDGAIGPFVFDPITGGHSNLTMTVTGQRRQTLRAAPPSARPCPRERARHGP